MLLILISPAKARQTRRHSATCITDHLLFTFYHLHERPYFSTTTTASAAVVLPTWLLVFMVLFVAAAVLSTVLSALPRPFSPLYSLSYSPPRQSSLRSFLSSSLQRSSPHDGTPPYDQSDRSRPRCGRPCCPSHRCLPRLGTHCCDPPCGGCPHQDPVAVSTVVLAPVPLAFLLAVFPLVFLLAAVLSATRWYSLLISA